MGGSNGGGEAMAAPDKPKEERGILSFLGILIGAGCMAIALVGALNTALDLKLALSVYGTSTAIPLPRGAIQ
jgi:hypothetical protein